MTFWHDKIILRKRNGEPILEQTVEQFFISIALDSKDFPKDFLIFKEIFPDHNHISVNKDYEVLIE